jgi:excisionase family DNA binding protein
MDKEEKYYTVPEVAEKLNVHPQTIRNWIRSGKLTASKPAVKVIVSEKSLQEFLKETEI